MQRIYVKNNVFFNTVLCCVLAIIIIYAAGAAILKLYVKPFPQKPCIRLGDDVLLSKYSNLIKGKKIGLVTNQTGVNSEGESIIDVLYRYKDAKLTALYAPEHGIDGKAKAGEYVASYTDDKLKLPVYSLYGETRMPSAEMLANIDVLVFDIQDIGARSYTYMSTLNYCMVAAEKYNKALIVLDRPNPLGGMIVEGPILEDKFISFVGIDNLPMTHGMTAGELAKFFNRKIKANITIVPMEGYKRDMVFQDTGLKWVQSSPFVPDIDAVFCYSATGLGEKTSIVSGDYFKWVGSKDIDSKSLAQKLNSEGLPGVTFIAEDTSKGGGVRLKINNYKTFNPAKTGIFVLVDSYSLKKYEVPKSTSEISMFDKIMGTDKIGQYIEQGLTGKQIEEKYKGELEKFKAERKQYLIYK